MTFDGAAYAGATAHHRAFDHDALRGLSLTPGMRVLDLGCGVGDLTSGIASAVDAGGPRGGWVLGVDASESCTRLASARRSPGLAFVTARAQDVGRLLPSDVLDAVISVAALHWVPRDDQPVVLAGIVDLLRPGGVLRAELGGEGQIAHVRGLLAPLAREAGAPECPWFFPSALEVGRLVVGAGLVVDMVRTSRQRRSMPDADTITRWLVSQVVPAYLAHLQARDHESFVAEAVRRCRAATRRDDKSHDQDYVRVQVLAAKRPRDLAGAVSSPPADFLVVADALLSTVRRLDASRVTDERKALLSGRFHRAAASARTSPAAALESLGALYDELCDLGDGA